VVEAAPTYAPRPDRACVHPRPDGRCGL